MKKADIYRSAGRNTAETANQGMQAANASTPSMTASLPTSGAPAQGSAAAVLACIILAFFALRFFAGKTGDGGDYKGITPSFYNIMVITLAGLLGGTMLKFAAVKTLPPNNAMRQLFAQGL